MEAKIVIYDRNGEVKTTGTVSIKNGRVSWLSGIMGCEHVARFPRGLVRRIALGWADDGGDREYTGWDDITGTQYKIGPATLGRRGKGGER